MSCRKTDDLKLRTLFEQRVHTEAENLQSGQLILARHWRDGWYVWQVIKVGKRHVIGCLVLGPKEWPSRYLQKLREKRGKTYLSDAYEGPAYCDVICEELYTVMAAQNPDFRRERKEGEVTMLKGMKGDSVGCGSCVVHKLSSL